MKVTLYKSTLEEVMKVANRTIGNAAQSITSHVLLRAAGNTLTAMSTDLTAATRLAVTAQVAEDGSICLPAKTLAEIVKKLPGWSGNVTISTNDKTWSATITYNSYRGNIRGLDPSDMPIMPTLEDLQNLAGSTVISLATPGLDRVIRQVSTFVQTKNVSDIKMGGVAVHFAGNTVTMTACDGNRMCVRTIPITGSLPPEPMELIMPRKQLNDFAELLGSASEAQIGVTQQQNMMVFRIPARGSGIQYVEIASQLIAGPYPDLSRIVPTKHATRIIVDRGDLKAALALADVLADKYDIIRLEVDPPVAGKQNGAITIAAQNPLDGDSEQTLTAKVEGRATEMYFNGAYLAQWLGLVDQETVAIELLNPRLPGLLYPVGVTPHSYFYVVMPMSPKGAAGDEEEAATHPAQPAASVVPSAANVALPVPAAQPSASAADTEEFSPAATSPASNGASDMYDVTLPEFEVEYKGDFDVDCDYGYE
jgi:DNA polymerase-3 subunit beta